MKLRNALIIGLAVSLSTLTSCQLQGSSSVVAPPVQSVENIPYDQFAHPFYPNEPAYIKTSNDNDSTMKLHVAKFVTYTNGLVDPNKAVFLLAPTYNGVNDRKDLTIWIMDNGIFQGQDRMAMMILNSITSVSGNRIDGKFDPQDYGDHLWEKLGQNLPKEASIYNFDINKEITSGCYVVYNGNTYGFSHYLVTTLDEVNAYYAQQLRMIRIHLYYVSEKE